MQTIESKYFVLFKTDATEGIADRHYISKEEFEDAIKTQKFQGQDVYTYKEDIVSIITQVVNGK